MTIDKEKLQSLLWAEAASYRADCADWKRNTEALQEFLGEKTVEEVALELLAENNRLGQIEYAFSEWIEKTDWVQSTVQASELGRHRADVLRTRIDQLKAENEALRSKLENPDPILIQCLDTAIAEQDQLEKDAARYRWTSTEGNWVARMFGKWRAHIGAYGDASPTEWYETREEAIDAAMNKAVQP